MVQRLVRKLVPRLVRNLIRSFARSLARTFALDLTADSTGCFGGRGVGAGIVGFHIPRSLRIADETLAQYLVATLHVAAQSVLLCQHFIIGKTRRDQGDADNEREDESNTQQS